MKIFILVTMITHMAAMVTAHMQQVVVDIDGRQHVHMEYDPDDEDSLNKASQDEEHIQDHYDGKVKLDYDSMTKEEKEFHFFKQHDFNEDGHLDGLEIFHAFGERVRHPEYPNVGSYEEREREYNEKLDKLVQKLTRGIDRILGKIDKDDNGYVSYVEYATAKRLNPWFKLM